MNRLRAIATIAAAVSLVSVAPASAASTTVGSTGMTFSNGGINCVSALQRATAPSSPKYVVPFDGTITSWSVAGVPGQESTAQLQVYRPLGASQWRLVAESAVQQVAAGGVSTFRARIPVRMGDVLGRTGLGCVYTSEVGEDDVQTFGYHPAVGSVVTPDGPGASAWRLNVSAKVEPDCSKKAKKKPKVCRRAR